MDDPSELKPSGGDAPCRTENVFLYERTSSRAKYNVPGAGSRNVNMSYWYRTRYSELIVTPQQLRLVKKGGKEREFCIDPAMARSVAPGLGSSGTRFSLGSGASADARLIVDASPRWHLFRSLPFLKRDRAPLTLIGFFFCLFLIATPLHVYGSLIVFALWAILMSAGYPAPWTGITLAEAGGSAATRFAKGTFLGGLGTKKYWLHVPEDSERAKVLQALSQQVAAVRAALGGET